VYLDIDIYKEKWNSNQDKACTSLLASQ